MVFLLGKESRNQETLAAMISCATGFRLLSLRAPAFALGWLGFCAVLPAAETTQAGTADIDYVRRVLLPSGHAQGVTYTAQPSAPAFYATRAGFYSLDPEDEDVQRPHQFFPNSLRLSGRHFTSSINGDSGFLHISCSINLTLASELVSYSFNGSSHGAATVLYSGGTSTMVMDATGMHRYRVFTPAPVTSFADSVRGHAAAGNLRRVWFGGKVLLRLWQWIS